jgi:hypothetical protein
MSEGGRSQRITIGFAGGQVLAVRCPAAAVADLHAALAGSASNRWYSLACEDGTVSLDLAQVAYVRGDSEDSRVGFGA